ncbi:uncharacterized protein B0I36DRAFT_399445 [Microdochium trichocladiopsis]|uniref:N-acetyltransferase domain-containing protein n=1 Tax=Microdochium trichocladiopsis TaxID=1682393 RepID=A0A9P9BI13_9PEZI|nr:uncharacterized protein B0I36DRAFT_399445 [Microdochium trichocladiopsis]KAH7012640.1 hypothetical protein B0I36DRAFT_399445 [Microdochium trichocladiopsis]
MTQDLERWELLENLGKGAFSQVYRARDLEGDAGEVAVKVVPKFKMNNQGAAFRCLQPGGVIDISDMSYHPPGPIGPGSAWIDWFRMLAVLTNAAGLDIGIYRGDRAQRELRHVGYKVLRRPRDRYLITTGISVYGGRCLLVSVVEQMKGILTRAMEFVPVSLSREEMMSRLEREILQDGMTIRVVSASQRRQDDIALMPHRWRVERWNSDQDLQSATELWLDALPSRFHLPQDILGPLLGRSNAHHSVVRDHTGLLGFCATYTMNADNAGDLVGSLGVLIVRSTHRGRGIGKSLHDEALGRLREQHKVRCLRLGSTFPRLLIGVPFDEPFVGWSDSASRASDWLLRLSGWQEKRTTSPEDATLEVQIFHQFGLRFSPCNNNMFEDALRLVAQVTRGKDLGCSRLVRLLSPLKQDMRDLHADVASRWDCQNYYGYDRWFAGQRNGASGLSNLNTEYIRRYKEAIPWIQGRIVSNSRYRTDNTKFWGQCSSDLRGWESEHLCPEGLAEYRHWRLVLQALHTTPSLRSFA